MAAVFMTIAILEHANLQPCINSRAEIIDRLTDPTAFAFGKIQFDRLTC